MTRYFQITLPAIALLSACGGAGTEIVEDPVTTFGSLSQTEGRDFSISNDDPNGVRVVFPGSSGSAFFNVRAAPAPGDDQDVFQAYRSFNYLIFDAESENGRVSVVANIDDVNASSLPSVRGDSAGGTLPLQGSATYVGEYVGFLTRDENSTDDLLTQSYITGDVEIDADFARDVASGSITNRERYSTATSGGPSSMGDVILSNLSFDGTGGGTGGRASGGGLGDTSRYQPVDVSGDWSLAFGGDNAAEAGGTLVLNHDYVFTTRSRDDYVETGGFVAAKQ